MVDNKNMADAMRAGMRHLASGVTVVATRSADGVRHAMTVTSMTSISDNPASILVCLHQDSTTNKSLTTTDFFSVNVLSEKQKNVSDRCAYTPENEDRFNVGEWHDYGEEKIPYLKKSLASFMCRVTEKISYGTHTVVIGNIVDSIVEVNDVAPLIYLRGDYLFIE